MASVLDLTNNPSFEKGAGDLDVGTDSPLILAGIGDDAIRGTGNPNTRVFAGPGNDLIGFFTPSVTPNQPGAQLFGESGDDFIKASTADDWIDGGVGHDQIWGRFGNDTITDIGGATDIPHSENYSPHLDAYNTSTPVFASQATKKFTNHQVNDSLDRDNINYLHAA